MTCPEIRELFSARVDDALTPEERARVDAHLATCPECALEWQRFEGTVGLLRAAPPARAPVGFVDRVLTARPQPWYRRLARGALVPWPVKLPLDAAAIVLVAGLAILLFQRSPELQQASRAAAPPVATPAPAPVPPIASTSPATPPASGEDRRADERKESPASPPSDPQLTLGRSNAAQSAMPPPDRLAESHAKDAAGPAKLAKKGVESDARAIQRKTELSHPAAPAAPPPAGEVRRRTSASVTDVHGTLAVESRESAERAVRDLMTRVDGEVLERADEARATTLTLQVPGDRWDEMVRGLAALGTLHLEPRSRDRSRPLRITLRLER